MKKQTINAMLFIVGMCGIFSACGNRTGNNTGALKTDSIQVNETTHLFGDTAKPACNLVVNLAYITESSNPMMKDSLNAYFLSAALGSEYEEMAPQEAVVQYSKEYANNYREDLEELYREDEKEYGDEVQERGWYNYYRTTEGHVQLYRKNLLVYRTDYEEYTGGAHGVYSSSFLNIDLKTLMPVRLDDLFADNYKEALTDLLWNQLMADNNVATRQELEDLGYGSTGDLEPTENFYLDKNGITFYYNIYEIAPYVMGASAITIPYEMLSHLLNDEFNILESVK